MRLLITGGAGFIGSAVVRYLIAETDATVINVDALTYAGNLNSLADALRHPRHIFEHVDIRHGSELARLFATHRPHAVMHLAAESHVDRSIDGPASFVETNVIGTHNLLEAAREYWNSVEGSVKAGFRFHHVSTDEVYGDLDETGALFTETTAYAPSSPYAASKAGADHLVRAWRRTYCFPTLITNCSNNYGPYHFPEKLIPLTILNALEGKPLPIYGHGEQIRDWLYVDDHAGALYKVLTGGEVGQTYNIGGRNEKRNIDVVRAICTLLDELLPDSAFVPHASLITHVADRPGHDRRYAIDASKIQRELAWTPAETFETGLRKTVIWFLENRDWCERVQDGSYQRQRLGVAEDGAV